MGFFHLILGIMSMSVAPKFLFVPVSCEEGIGEYMRSTIVADEIMQRWPGAQIEFVLNSRAPTPSIAPIQRIWLTTLPPSE